MTSKEYDPFKDLVKLPDDTVMHIGLYTDGLGHVFKGRKAGTSDWVEEDTYKYRYNFATSKIELADDKNSIFYSSNLSLGNWLDGPDYWAKAAMDEVNDLSRRVCIDEIDLEDDMEMIDQ